MRGEQCENTCRENGQQIGIARWGEQIENVPSESLFHEKSSHAKRVHITKIVFATLRVHSSYTNAIMATLRASAVCEKGLAISSAEQ